MTGRQHRFRIDQANAGLSAAQFIQTEADRNNTELKIDFDFLGKARLTMKNKAGDIVFQGEYSGTELRSRMIHFKLGHLPNHIYTTITKLYVRRRPFCENYVLYCYH